jgi:hypothetical protein
MILITDAIIYAKKKYIIVITGLDKKIVDNVCLEMAQDLKYTYLCYLDHPNNNNRDIYSNIHERVDTLLNIKPQGIIISLLSFSENLNLVDVKLHINLSINKNYFESIKKMYKYNDDFFNEYNDIIKSNKFIKYINIKLDSDLNDIKDKVFNNIIIYIEKAYYGLNYKKILEDRVKNNIDKIVNSGELTDITENPTDITQDLTETIDDIET